MAVSITENICAPCDCDGGSAQLLPSIEVGGSSVGGSSVNVSTSGTSGMDYTVWLKILAALGAIGIAATILKRKNR